MELYSRSKNENLKLFLTIPKQADQALKDAIHRF
jgi:hypothetical protein